METALYEDQMDEMTEEIDRDYDNISEPRRLTLAYKQLVEKSPSLGNLQRYETRLSRQIQRCQKHLADLRPIVANPNKSRGITNCTKRTGSQK